MLDHQKIEGVEALVAQARKLKSKIAIDGPAGAGKSTVARCLADRLGYLYIDTGAMYRAATLIALRQSIPFDDNERMAEELDQSCIALLPPDRESAGRQRVFINGKDETETIRSQEISKQASAVSALVSVRERLVAKQRAMAENGAVVMDGRDIGTVVLPDADLKIFLTASPEVRARRRYLELTSLGQECDYEVVLEEMKERDRKDSTRTIAPLKPAQDAIIIMSDIKSVEQVVEEIIGLSITQEGRATGCA